MKKTVEHTLYEIADIAEEIVIASEIPKESLRPHYTDYSIVPGDLIRCLIRVLHRLDTEQKNDP